VARIEVPMPQMGESIAEGTVSKWLKSVGESVQRDEPILEISTDKVDAEIPAPASGTIVAIEVQEGQTVEVGTIVAYIDTEGGAPSGNGGAPAKQAAPAAAPAAPPAVPAPMATSRNRPRTGCGSARRRWCARSRRSTASTSPRSRAPATPAA
jgi:2-oxoglutarate dehydrogenase E2 component (dihydrolipoamide succinyltransferase)